jgi:hypothetical protein
MTRSGWVIIIVLFLSMHGKDCLSQGFFSKLAGTTDTNYVESYLDLLTTRVYGSVKSAEISMRDGNLGKNLIYRPNDATILGFGFNYGILGLNIGFNFPFINDDDAEYGETEYIDLQTHIYLRTLTLDVYLQSYKGYYLTKPNDWIVGWPEYDTLPKRPDINSISIGLNGQYLFNHKKFSYRAPFLQNEWQKKSAGSFLAGGNIFYVDTRGDSSLIPKGLVDSNFFQGVHFSQYRIINIGVIAGYAQTFVVKQHWFLTLSLVGGLSGGGSWIYTSEAGEVDKSGVTVAGNLTGRVALGYNSKRFFAGLSYLGIFVRNQSPISRTWLGYDTDVFRLNVVYRFRLKKDLRFLSGDQKAKK